MKFQRNSIWPALVALMLPQPLLAIETGVNAVNEVEEIERLSLTAWAFEELRELFSGNETLEPILPRVESSFDVLDAEIALFIAQGQQEQARLQEMIDRIGEPKEQDEASVGEMAVAAPTVPAASEKPADTGFFYTAQDFEMELLPDVTIGGGEDAPLLGIDTSNGIDLPDLTFDPRNGGEYSSEIEAVQTALDVLQLVQDQVPAPIQTAGNEIYNKIAGNLPSDN